MTADHRGEPAELTPDEADLVARLLHDDPTPPMPEDVFNRLQDVVDDEVRRRDETIDPVAWAREAKKKAMSRFGNTEHHADTSFANKTSRPDRIDHSDHRG